MMPRPSRYIARWFELGRVFPSGDPLANVVFRLCVLREDLHLEMRALSALSDDEPVAVLAHHDVWLGRLYFLRRIALSLSETEKILNARVLNDFARTPPPGTPPAPLGDFVRNRRQLRRAIKRIRWLRNRLAAHLDEAHCAELLRTRGSFLGPLQLSEFVTDIVWRLPSQALVVALTPGQVTDANAVPKFGAFLESLRSAHDAALFAVDYLMSAYLVARGLWHR